MSGFDSMFSDFSGDSDIIPGDTGYDFGGGSPSPLDTSGGIDGGQQLSPEQLQLLASMGLIPPGIAGTTDPTGMTSPNGEDTPGMHIALPGMGSGGGKGFSLTNPDGSLNMSSLVPLLASIFGGLTGYNATKKGSTDMVNALNTANTQITGLLGPGSGAMAGYQPYQTLGQTATGKLGAYNYQPLAAKFPSAVAPKGK